MRTTETPELLFKSIKFAVKWFILNKSPPPVNLNDKITNKSQ